MHATAACLFDRHSRTIPMVKTPVKFMFAKLALLNSMTQLEQVPSGGACGRGEATGGAGENRQRDGSAGSRGNLADCPPCRRSGQPHPGAAGTPPLTRFRAALMQGRWLVSSRQCDQQCVARASLWVILSATAALRAGCSQRSDCLARGVIHSTNRSFGNWSRLPVEHVVPVRIAFRIRPHKIAY